MYLTENLIEKVFEEQYRKGFRNLRILTGYSSAAFLYYIVNKYQDLNIELIIGMASKDGIRKADHVHFTFLEANNPNISVKYHKSFPSIHTKIYHWFDEGMINDSITFIGSANFSWNGFRDQTELLAQVDSENIEEVFNFTDAISCNDSAVGDYITFADISALINEDTDTLGLIKGLLSIDTPVTLPLLLKENTAIHERGGLNWGQRINREPNQAYIPVPAAVHQKDPDFFPPYKHPFTLITDDGESFICVMSQAKRKAIETSSDNSILGKYFRRRLNVNYGKKVEVQDVLDYGRTFVDIYKIDQETYFMDFNNN